MKPENSRVRRIIREFREHYNFEQKHVIELSGLSQSKYQKLEAGVGNIDFDDAKTISSVYGLEVWQFINPNQVHPTISSLPIQTRELAKELKDKVLLSKFDIPAEIATILQTGKLNHEFTTSEIRTLLPQKIRDNIETSRITDVLAKKLAPLVTKTNKKLGTNFIYVLNK
ncbi:MAG: helix-turn-helix transcriptional regulator [Gelidibacter sp.]